MLPEILRFIKSDFLVVTEKNYYRYKRENFKNLYVRCDIKGWFYFPISRNHSFVIQ